jgi:23S rRNA (cytosine1962-C5)-methyltransferase
VESTEESLPTVYLKPGDADRVLAGHPWIYEGNILRLTREPADGAVIQVKDHRRRFLGVGFYNSKSRIRVRVLSDQRRDIDAAFLEQRLRAAIEHRRRFMPGASSCRLVNAEGDLLSGLVVDKYEDVLVLQTSSVGMDQRKTTIAEILNRLLAPRAILERNDMPSRKFEGLPETHGVLAGTLSETDQAAVPVLMNGLRFEANLAAGHKTGLYLDQQLNHLRVAALTRGARVLDAFCFLGGFGLHAARAGASSVLGIDQSAEAVQTAQRIAASNGLSDTCRFEAANVFDWLRTATATTAPAPATGTGTAGSSLPSPTPECLYDVVILDPPSFTRNRASVPDALRGYKEIHLRALKLLRPGGILATFCCSHHVDAATFEAVVLEASLDARRLLRRIESYGQSPDHPIIPTIPESEYLKGFAYEAIAP